MSAAGFWDRSKNNTRDSCDPYYGVMRLTGDGMTALRELFPEGLADDLNFVLFSTSGVHGTYCLIEDVEAGGDDSAKDVTFVVIQPRIVCIRYGNCTPQTPDDFFFLKRLRESSQKAAASIGVPATKEQP